MDYCPTSDCQVVSEWQRRLADRLVSGFDAYEANEGSLPGFTPARRESLIRQLVDSSRINVYVDHLCSVQLSPQAADPADAYWFDPLKAAIIHHRAGDDDEAFWIIFLRTHFGRHRRAGWRYLREVYGALGSGEPWTWQRVVGGIDEFRDWLDEHRSQLSDSRLPHGFGNHRKYESLRGWTEAGTGSVVASYIAWVGEPPRHRVRFDTAFQSETTPEATFELLYWSMVAVRRFGRLARFDYLDMVGKIGLADIRPGKAYLQGSTGPFRGASLLFQTPGERQLTATALEYNTATLQGYLGVTYDVIEDALCNWQKSPAEFKQFRG